MIIDFVSNKFEKIMEILYFGFYLNKEYNLYIKHLF